MPYTALKDGKLVGLDSDILAAVASKLGLKIETSMTDFPGMLAAVQSQRADITIGGIAWSDARRKVGLFTDPPYYSPPAMAVHGTADYPDVASLEGMALGTVTGYVWAKSIAQVPKASPHTYPTADSVFEDLSSGRLDVGFLDPLLIIYQQQQRPDMKFKVEYLNPPAAEQVAAHPDYKYFQPYMTGFLPAEAGTEAHPSRLRPDRCDVQGRLTCRADHQMGRRPEAVLDPVAIDGGRAAWRRPPADLVATLDRALRAWVRT
jgi:ABC-type amino acid transport substrate-binding protein